MTVHEQQARPVGGLRGHRSLRVGLASFLLAPFLALALVVSTGVVQPAQAVYGDAPCTTVAGSLAPALAIGGGTGVLSGTAAGGGVAAGGAATGGAVAGTSAASALVAGVMAFGAGYCGTIGALNWLFDSPPEAGPQPLNGSATYLNSAGQPESWPAGYVKMGGCHNGTMSGFVTGFANANAPTCFAGTNSPGNFVSTSWQINTTSWRCLGGVSSCGSVFGVIFQANDGLSVGGSSQISGTNSTATCTSSCRLQWSGSLTNAARQTTGYDLFYDPTKIEFSPPAAQFFKTTKSCRSSGGVSTSSVVSTNFYGSEGGQRDLAPGTACPAGDAPVSWRIEVCLASVGTCTDVASWVASPRLSNPSPTDPWKNCLPGGASAPCKLKLLKNTSTGFKLCDGSSDCHTFDPDADWSPNTWKCQWGSLVVGLTDCSPLIKWATGTSVNTNTDPDPAPQLQPGGGTLPGTGGQPGTDPGGNPDPSTSPSPTSPTNPGQGPNPTPGVGDNPDVVVPTPDSSTDPDSEGCLGKEWSWNPVSWVYAPVKCAFIWAFIPRPPMPSLQTRVETMTALAGTKAPFSWIAGFGALPAGIGIADGGCPDWRIKVNPTQGDTLDKNVVCDSSYTQAIRSARPVLAGFMVLLAVWPILRSIGYASFPLVKPVPSKI